MQNWAVLILVAGIAIANVPALIDQWRHDRPGFIKTLWLLGAYALYVALGIVLLIFWRRRRARQMRKRCFLPACCSAGSSTAG